MKERTWDRIALGLCFASLGWSSGCNDRSGAGLGGGDRGGSSGSSAVDRQARGSQIGGEQALGGQAGTGQSGNLRLLITDQPFPLAFISEATVTITRVEARLAGADDDMDTDGDSDSDEADSDADSDHDDSGQADSEVDSNGDDRDDADTDGDDESFSAHSGARTKRSDGDSDDAADSDNGDSDDADTDGDDDSADTDGDTGTDGADSDSDDGDDDTGSDGLDTSGGDQPDAAEFVTLFEGERTVSLLDLRNGRTSILAEAVVTAGRYTQIQLIITMGSITLSEPDNRKFELAVSDEGQGEIGLNLAFEVLTSGQTVLLLDFDLGKSFKPLPEGDLDEPGMIEGFEFTPWLRLSDLGNSAALAGTVTDYQFNPLGDVAVTVFQDGDEVSTTFTDSDGGYQVLGLPGGSYRLEFSLHGFEDGEWADVFVEPGQTQEGVDIALTPDDDSQAD